MPVKDEPVALYNKQFGSGPSLVILHGLFGSCVHLSATWY